MTPSGCLNFAIGALVSFLGSLPPGVLNATVVQLTQQRGVRQALRFAGACRLVELLYSGIAFAWAKAFLRSQEHPLLLESLSTGLLFAAGMYYVFRSSPVKTLPIAQRPFAWGILLSLVNVAAIPFWLGYTTLLARRGWIQLQHVPDVGFYLGGIGTGTFLAFGLFALAGRYGQRFGILPYPLLNRLVGLWMVATSLGQLVHSLC